MRTERGWHRGESRPLVLGHRGAREDAPENTMAAFELAVAQGADGVELDVRLDGAGEVVVIHDATLARVTRGSDERAIDALDRRDLDAIDLGGGERVPRLATVLAWARRSRVRVNVEIKSDVRQRWQLVRRVAGLVESMPDAARHVLVSSFHPGIIAAFGRLVPRVPRGIIVGRSRAWTLRTRALVGAVAVHPERTLTSPELVRGARESGVIVNVWTVNDEREARDLAALGVNALISDRPGAILRAVG